MMIRYSAYKFLVGCISYAMIYRVVMKMAFVIHPEWVSIELMANIVAWAMLYVVLEVID